MRALRTLIAVLLAGCGPLQLLVPPASHLDPARAGPDYEVQGDYAGVDPPMGAQVVALGDDEFEAVLYRGGLPGAGWDRTERVRAPGARRDDGRVTFEGAVQLAYEGGALVGTMPEGTPVKLGPFERRSPTLGARPPPGAVIVFRGSTRNVDGEVDGDGNLKAGASSRDEFRDFDLHLEFRTPFTPDGRGQFRGNSGVYLQDRYEVQVLDSFGLPEKDDDCGGIYDVAAPEVNMAYPPLRWQTYDVSFTAARFDEAGEKTANARVTVLHNGVRIHDDVEIPGPTGGGAAEEDTPGPVYLQDHWNPVVYRNVWVVPR